MPRPRHVHVRLRSDAWNAHEQPQSRIAHARQIRSYSTVPLFRYSMFRVLLPPL